MASVLVLGDVMLDVTIAGVVLRTSPEDPQAPLSQCSDFTYNLGGAANVAEILAAEGHQVTLVGAVADDWPGQIIHNLCDLCHVTQDFHQILAVTSTKLRIFDEAKYMVRADVERVVAVPPFTIPTNSFDAVVLSDYNRGIFHLGMEATVLGMMDHQATIPVVADYHPTHYMGIFRGASAAAPNLRQAYAMGELLDLPEVGTDAELAAQLRVAMAVGCMAITMGAQGAMVATEEDVRHVVVPQTVDPQVIGAGDAFTVGMAVALAEGVDYFSAAGRAAEFANEYVGRVRVAVPGSLL